MRPHATIREVGLRDGLQLVKSFLATERKIAWFHEEVAAGLREVEVTSFVPPSVVPQFADAAEVAQAAVAIDGLVVAALVPNLKGATRGFDAGVGKINFVLSASEAHNLANVRRSTAESVADFGRIIAERKARGLATKVVAGIATTFGCTIQGHVPEAQVLRLVESLAAAGSDEIVLADTVGYANPAQVKRIFSAVAAIFDKPIYAHFHDTRGLGLANVSAAVDAGITRFDASIGGLGGCPFAPGASGNIDTEDCAFLLESLGFDTGLDIEKLVALRERVAQWLPQERVGGMIAQAGLPKTFGRTAQAAE
ncbi:MAG TPA: hydroxymethylglutaryl-CoA lyase [Xanthobacteraceae bacterium]|jgi:hydroxymethylglutaryl-CoA lyase|nr:hydroxymethylglutaryl-CoA lyase [Xanthobacteraceae bacterium]